MKLATKKSSLDKIAICGGTAFILFWVLIPFYFLIVVGLIPKESTAIGLELPKEVTLQNYRNVMVGSDSLWKYLSNSCIVAGVTTLISLSIAVPCAYVTSRWRAMISKFAYISVFMSRTFPPITLIIPYYIIARNLNLIDTKIGLIVIYLSLSLPLAVWLLRGFFDMVPVELEEAAEIDGATIIQRLVKIVLPLMIPALSITAGFVFIHCYVEYMYCLTITEQKAATFPIYITGFIGDHRIFTEDMVAASIMGLIPLVFLYSFVGRYIKKGIAVGAFK